jgi:hypothetical protein
MFFTMLPFHGVSARGEQRRRTFWVALEPLAIRQCEFGFKDRCLQLLTKQFGSKRRGATESPAT